MPLDDLWRSAVFVRPLAFLGNHLSAEANKATEQSLHAHESKPVLCIQVDEEREIAAFTEAVVNAGQ